MPNICFVSLKSYDLLSENPEPRFIGGAERQQVLVARGLQRLGYQVSFVTLDFGQPDSIEHKGIRVFKAYDPDCGLPLLRAVSPRWTGLNAALHRANADIYHQMCADFETGQVALWCRRNGKKLVFAVASDADCEVGLPLLATRRQRWLYRYGLRRADRVVAQTVSQKSNLSSNYGIKSTLIPSCTGDSSYELPDHQRLPKADKVTIIWVSRIVPLKRLELLLDLAPMCPTYRFLVVGGGDESTPYLKDIFARAHRIPNVEMLGRIADEELWRVYEQADLLLDTASIAGVPTTFLEAWARGVPVVSTINPDGIISSWNLGRFVTNTDEMREALTNLLGDPEVYFECSRSAHQFFKQNHTVQQVSAAYHELFAGMK